MSTQRLLTDAAWLLQDQLQSLARRVPRAALLSWHGVSEPLMRKGAREPHFFWRRDTPSLGRGWPRPQALEPGQRGPGELGLLFLVC